MIHGTFHEERRGGNAIMRMCLLAFPIVLSAGCSTGYAIDHLRPKTALIGPQLMRYGLNPGQVQCVGQYLGQHLSTQQLRRLSDAARAVTPGVLYPEKLKPTDLLWIATQAKDQDLGAAVARASDDCKLTVLPAPDPAKIASEAAPVAEGGESIEERTANANATIQNGPRDYQPSDKLWAAFEAYERRDFDTAAKLAIAASDEGDSGAQQFVGGLYATGQGVRTDQAAAVRYYALAAEKGWSEAMTNLGMAYQNGAGVTRNPVEALKWYLLASHRPTEDAQLVERNRQGLSATMTLDEITEAGTLAWRWEQNRGK
jgi:hypothetical protein